MKKITAFLFALFLANMCAFAQTQPLVIYDASKSIDDVRTQGVTIERVENGMKIKNGTEDNWPGVHFLGQWDLTDYTAIEITAILHSTEPSTLYLRFDSAGCDMKTLDGVVQQGCSMEPGKPTVFRVAIPNYLNKETRAKLFAMRGKPGGIRTDSYSRDVKIPFDKSAVTAFRPFASQNGRQDVWTLVSIVAIPNDETSKEKAKILSWGPDKFFPMIDKFGQFKHADWPGKTHSLEELRAQIENENADIAANQPAEFNEYGGWKNGPQLEATGAFRVQKIDGVWHMVDPSGRIFWSNGVDCVNSDSSVTPVSEREFYFDSEIPTRPSSDNKMSQFLSESSHSVNNFYADYGKYRQYNFSASNLYLKYGEDWRAKLRESIARRLPSWGLNTVGNWSNIELIRDLKLPYVATLGANSPKIEGSEGYWGKFVDPFHEEFGKSVRRSLNSKLWTATDPYCIGYFVDNEISWGEAGSLSKAALASSKDQPAKIAYVDWLKERYQTIDAFNAAWETTLESWDALLNEPFKTPDSAKAKEDSNLFYSIICEKYFSEIVAVLRDMAPNRLYLGCRFAWTNELARRAGQKYCDVVSYNFYKKEVGSFTPVEGEDKPVIIGEFHFGALDRGLFHTGLVPCKDQIERAKAYEEYVKSALGNPWIVGVHWFQYQDQATTGRFDGENYQIGFVDVCDRPYPETIEAVRRVGYNMYQIRMDSAKR